MNFLFLGLRLFAVNGWLLSNILFIIKQKESLLNQLEIKRLTQRVKVLIYFISLCGGVKFGASYTHFH